MRREYMLTRDIDWFAKIGSKYVHFASNGSILPINLEHSKLRQMQQAVANIEVEMDDVRINQQLINAMRENGQLEGTTNERYLRSFKIFASKGFYSFDYNRKEQRYRLVAMPGNGNRKGRLAEIQLPVLAGKQDLEQDCLDQIREME